MVMLARIGPMSDTGWGPADEAAGKVLMAAPKAIATLNKFVVHEDPRIVLAAARAILDAFVSLGMLDLERRLRALESEARGAG